MTTEMTQQTPYHSTQEAVLQNGLGDSHLGHILCFYRCDRITHGIQQWLLRALDFLLQHSSNILHVLLVERGHAVQVHYLPQQTQFRISKHRHFHVV
jgi:hypothetical protein